MKVIHLSYSDVVGGAARAAYRIHQALRESSIDSYMSVNLSSSDDWTVVSPSGVVNRALLKIRPQIEYPIRNLLKTTNFNMHSPCVLSSAWPDRLNSADCDLVNLHWVQAEMLSVSDIGKVRKPIVWTLHDMWAFCGAEHYTDDFRWRDGYTRSNRPVYESGFDLNRWTWLRKCKYWNRPMHIVAPSRWLADCVRQSSLMHDWPISVIPNPIDHIHWKPIEKSLARDLLGLPQNVPLVLFGAIGGTNDPRKGIDLLLSALSLLRADSSVQGLQLLIFGQSAPRIPLDLGFPVNYTGHLHDDLSLRAVYSSADLMVVPSRQDNLPNTAVEAHACGLPIVAFNIGGLSDIVVDGVTGVLVDSFNVQKLASAISSLLSRPDTCLSMGDAARESSLSRRSFPRVSSLYQILYRKVIDSY